jgi:hypothetical protein
MRRYWSRSVAALVLTGIAACSGGDASPGGTGGPAAGTGGPAAGAGGAATAGTGGAATGGDGGGAAGAGGGPGAAGGSIGGTGGTGTGGLGEAGRAGASAAGSGGRAGSGGSGGAVAGAGGGGQAGRGGSGGQAGSGGRAGGGGVAGVAGSVGQAGTGGGGGAAAGASGSGGSPLPPITDYGAPGPFATTTQQNTGPNGKYTIIRPQTLGQNGFLHAPITFGPGIGMEVTGLMGLLSRFASHGFVVIGTRLDGAPNDPNNRMAMLDGLNWILQQNTTAGSVFQGKLDVKHAVSMGYSVGGTAAVEIGNHEAVATVVSIHGHKATSALHGPMLQTSGTADTVGLPMQQYTFDNSKVQTFLGTVSGADHGYIQTTVNGVPGGVQTPAIVAWIRYWIYNDTGGRRYFDGDDCVMCKAPWTNPQRKNWP